MRIIGGKFRGTVLASVGKGDTAAHLRPTTDRVRESLFNVLEHGGYPTVRGARVLDLFAGTGALGLEALSRGAATVQFVDDGAVSARLIQRNIEILRLGREVRFYRRNATKPGQNRSEPFNLVFLDPPYGKNLGEKALSACLSGGWLSSDALVVWEEGCDITPSADFAILDQRKYGDTHITILQRKT